MFSRYLLIAWDADSGWFRHPDGGSFMLRSSAMVGALLAQETDGIDWLPVPVYSRVRSRIPGDWVSVRKLPVLRSRQQAQTSD